MAPAAPATFVVGGQNAQNWDAEEKAAAASGAAEWSDAVGSHIGDVGYSERPMANSGFKPSTGRPVWQRGGWADLFATPYTEGRNDADGSSGKMSNRQPPLLSLIVSMELLEKACAHIEKECDAGSPAGVGISRVVAALSDASKLVTMVPTQKLPDEAMVTFLGRLVPQIQQTAVGETRLIPVNLQHMGGPMRRCCSRRSGARVSRGASRSP